MLVETKTMQRKAPILISQFVPLFPAQTNACALLNQFKPQEPNGQERCIAVKKTVKKSVLRLEKALEKAADTIDDMHSGVADDIVGNLEKSFKWKLRLGLVRFSRRDLDLLLRTRLPFTKHEMLSASSTLVLSALMNASRKNNFTINVNAFEDLHLLGCANKKDMVVYGFAGDSAFYGMLSGSVTIHGDCGENFALNMAGGNIHVDGNILGDSFAHGVSHGKISVNGNIPLLPENSRGAIFQRKKKLMEFGRRLGEPENK